jgi:hypothetical protein
MSRIVSQSFAAFAAILLTLITIGAIVAPPPAPALAAAGVLA